MKETRMKLSKLSYRLMASVVTTGMVLSLTACSLLNYTVAYVYAPASQKGAAGVVNEYAVDYLTGALIQVTGSPVKAGNNPVSIVASPSGLFVYVLNHDDSTVQEYAVGSDGSLTSKNTYPITGTFPTAAAIDQGGKFLYVTFTYQAGYSATNPGPGGVTIFTTSNFNSFVYVVDQEVSPNAAVLGFAEDKGTGALTPTPGTVITTVAGKTVATGYPAGTTPSAIAEAPTARFVYVTDQATNQLYGKVVQADGSLVSMVNGPFATGLFPVAITIDPRGKYMYTVNFNSNSVSAFVIDQATGTPSGSVGSSSTPVKTGPTCITIEPALGIFTFVSNSADGSISGEQLDPHNGGLKDLQNTPYPASGTPTCAVAVANGAHATQIVQP
jgi:6-phosphogluconolactonase